MTRLMCSSRQEEVGAVKRELFKAGIRSEIRRNPLTAALNITRLELWVENDNDYFAAQKCYARMQASAKNTHEPAVTLHPNETAVVVEDAPPEPTEVVTRAAALDEKDTCQRPHGELEEASLLLAKEIEEALEREDALSETCATLRSEVASLSRSLSESQAAAEKKAAEFAALRKECDEQKQLASQARAELAAEKKSRIAAEEKAAKSAKAQERLEKRLAEQKDLQEQVRASIGSLNSLRGRLQAKKTSGRR